jgi:hypothetical protein
MAKTIGTTGKGMKEMASKKTVSKPVKTEKLPFVVVRAYRAGVHAGELVSRKGTEVVLRNSIRIWEWSGAMNLSELAVYGAKNRSECRFAVPVEKSEILDACEIIYTQPEGAAMIRETATWRA